MIRKMLALTLVAAAAVLALATGALARSHPRPTLVGTVGPGFTITLTMNHKIVKRLKAGVYRLVVHDKASIHAFSLDGPHGYAKDLTTVPFVGTKTFTLTLRPGAYKAYCPPHEPNMFQHFTVTK
jgi:plastocyanin